MQRNYDANTVKTLVLVGFIFYGLATLGDFTNLLNGPWDFNPFFPWFDPLLRGLDLIVSIGFSIWAYLTYKKISEGDYTDTRTSTLTLRLFGLLPNIGAFFGGIFFLLAYWKLGNVVPFGHDPHYPSTQIPTVNRFCVQCGRIVGVDNIFCSHCGAQLPE